MSGSGKNFKNKVTLAHILLACRHFGEIRQAGISENLAIRTLELFVDVYAKVHHGGSPAPHHVDQVLLWSLAARELRRLNPDIKPKDYLRVEHGTPRRGLARKILELYEGNRLTEETLQDAVQKFWKLAVITIEEDQALNKNYRSKVYDCPDDRWAAAGIKFDDLDNK